MDLYLYKLWNFDRYAEPEDDEEIDARDCENHDAILKIEKVVNALPLINGFYGCCDILSVYPYSEIGKFGNVGHLIHKDGTYVIKAQEYGMFLPFQNKNLAKEVVYKGLMNMGCPIAAEAVKRHDVYSLSQIHLYEWDKTSIAYAKKCDKALSARIEKGLPLVYCDAKNCIDWKEGVCKDDTFHAGICTGFMRYDDNPVYKKEYWSRCTENETNRTVRVKHYGRRVRVDDLALFTSDDIRPHAIESASFVEEKTGLKLSYKYLQKYRTDAEFRKKVQNVIKKEPLVLTLPIKEEKDA